MVVCCTVHLAVAAAVTTGGAAVTAAVAGWVGVDVTAALAMPVVVARHRTHQTANHRREHP